jgi:hypothetical protein
LTRNWLSPLTWGGTAIDKSRDIAVDDAGNIYVVGWTLSGDFPTIRALAPKPEGYGLAFVTQIIQTDGVYTYGFSSYLGGSGSDEGKGIAVDSAGSVYVTGVTTSNDFPTYNAVDVTCGGCTGFFDAFVTKIISAGGVYTLGYSTFLGGNSDDFGLDIAVDGE